MSEKIHPEKLFGEIEQFVSESRSLLEQGAMMELAGLDDRIQHLCEAVLALTQEQRIEYGKLLQALLFDLTELGKALAAKRDAVADDIRKLGTHQKAAIAYHTADSRDEFGKKKDDK